METYSLTPLYFFCKQGMGAHMFQSPDLFFIFGTYKSTNFQTSKINKNHTDQSYLHSLIEKKNQKFREVEVLTVLLPTEYRMLMH